MFEINDLVKKIGSQDVLKVVQIRSADQLYYVQRGNDAATAEWVKESELELHAKAKKPDTGSGFVPDKPLF